MIKVGIIGSTGYAGAEIVRLIQQHKEAEVVWFGSRSYVDEKYADVFKNMSRYTGRRCGGKRRPRGFRKIYRQYFPAPVLQTGITPPGAAAGCSAPGGGRMCRPPPRCCPGWNGCTTRRRAGYQ